MHEFNMRAEIALSRDFQELIKLLETLSPYGASSEQLRCVQAVLLWLRGGLNPRFSGRERALGIAYLLAGSSLWKKAAAAALRGALATPGSLSRLFSGTGLPERRGPISETFRRVGLRVDPRPAGTDLGRCLAEIFQSGEDLQWFRELPDALFEKLTDCLAEDPSLLADFRERIRRAAVEALSDLADSLTALALTSEIRQRSESGSLAESPVLNLAFELERISGPIAPETLGRCMEAIARCRVLRERALKETADLGSGLLLLYRLEKLDRTLNRITILLGLLVPSNLPLTARIRAFLEELIESVLEERVPFRLLSRILRSEYRLLIRQVERTGDKYIGRTAEEYLDILRSAGGAGLIMAGTTIIKFVILWMKASFLFGGLLVGANYSASFLLMQLMHFGLATKQASPTGSAFLARLERHALNGPSAARELLEEIASVSRSQLAAVAANGVMVAVGAALFHFFYHGLTGRLFLTPKAATHVIQSLDPLHSMTVPDAILTGVLLWASTLIGGWFKSALLARRVPRRLSRTLQPWFGAERARAFSHWFGGHLFGIGSSISLGFLMALPQLVGQIYHLPLDVRHFTLSTGSLALAFCTRLHTGNVGVGLPAALAGILVVVFFNLVVSFGIAIAVGMHVRGLDRRFLKSALRSAHQHLWVEPGRAARFLWLLLLPPEWERVP